jgi:hypothetical protein
LTELGVELRACEQARALFPAAIPATEEDWATEFLALILAIRVVGSVEEAIAHLKKCGVRVLEHKDADGDKIAIIHPKDMHGAMIEIRRGKRMIRDA